jgi:hypothetical protein
MKPLREIEKKAIRLIVEERVTLLNETPGEVRGQVEGDTGNYQVLWSLDPEACMCQCPANREGHRRCSHLLAVELAHAQRESEQH